MRFKSSVQRSSKSTVQLRKSLILWWCSGFITFFFFDKESRSPKTATRHTRRDKSDKTNNGPSCSLPPPAHTWANHAPTNLSTFWISPSLETVFPSKATSLRCSQMAHITANLLPSSASQPLRRFGIVAQNTELDLISESPWLAQILIEMGHWKNRCSQSSSCSPHNMHNVDPAETNNLCLTRVNTRCLANIHAKIATLRGSLCFHTSRHASNLIGSSEWAYAYAVASLLHEECLLQESKFGRESLAYAYYSIRWKIHLTWVRQIQKILGPIN